MKVSNQIAALALAVSIGTAVFTGYRWETTEKENRISAAIDISKKYLEDKDVSKRMAALRTPGNKQDSEEVNRLFYRLNYIAYLANAERIDRNYLALQIRCDINEAYTIVAAKEPKDGFVAENISEMKKFREKHSACLSEGS